MSCQDDITTADIAAGVSHEVLERLSAGDGSNTNLYPYINTDQISGINLDIPESAKTIVKPYDQRHDLTHFCESGTDDEMILHIPFTASLRLRSLLLLPPSPDSPDRPSKIRIYTNLPHAPDFGELENMKPVQTLDVSQAPGGWVPNVGGGSGSSGGGEDMGNRGIGGRREVEDWGLVIRKMSSVWSVTLLITDSPSGTRSKLYYLGFTGTPPPQARSKNEGGTVPAANAADAPVKSVAEKSMGSNTTIH